MNRVELKANLGQDPKALGDKGLMFSLALSNDYQKDGQWQKQDPTWIDVKCWGKVKDKVNKLGLSKGDRVIVSGKLTHEEYDGKIRHQVNAFDVDKIVKPEKPSNDDSWGF